jgi:hypothetical protein
MCILALKKCKIETEGVSKINVYRSDREEVGKPIEGVVDVHQKFDLDDFRGERANLFGLEQIGRAMQALERAGNLQKGAYRRMRDEVLRTGFDWSDPMTRWIRRGTSSDAFRVVVRTAHNGTRLDAEFRFADGEKGILPLLGSGWAPDFLSGRLQAMSWKSTRSIELRFYSDNGSHRNQFYGLRALDSRGIKDLEAEIVAKESVTFRYSLDRIHPSASTPKPARAKSKKK